MKEIKDLHEKETGTELRATIVSIEPVRKIWKCFDCMNANREPFKGLWKDESEFMEECPTCSAKQSTEKGKGIWIQRVTDALIDDGSGRCNLTLWNDDIEKYEMGDKIHLINGYVQMFNDKLTVSKGKYGTLEKEADKE